ncbi:MAG: tRNA (N(6)-L-threonylcarbamoyladenosine(37)-C(2))-methylthiotransferase [Candidatus Altiarchaeales archaeon]|nr:tRNA (N(6)-L-threonylcarbamoyladenosine(37)-C(2))-methylthiotransferase [Candidatus Altiarchaeales archaeon]
MPAVEIETYGCAMNQADSETMAGLLSGAGFDIRAGAQILVINTCTVKTPTERKIRKRLRELQDSGKTVIVAGCLPAASEEIADEFPNFSFIGLNVSDIVEAAKRSLGGEVFVKIREGSCRLKMPHIRGNPYIEIVPIAQGCVGCCSYCITRQARGHLVSCPPELILERVRTAVSEGIEEVWITAQDTGAYGKDLDDSGSRDLPALLDEIVAVEGVFRVRVGMMGPNHALGMLSSLINSFGNEKIYKFLHIPVQSGDDGVLRDMNRRYGAGDFIRLVCEFRRRFPDITISTDVIVGFPTESEEAFHNTLKLIGLIRPDVLNITRFWVRPGTQASTMKQLPTRISKDRSRLMNKLFQEIGFENNKRWVGCEGKVLVSKRGREGSFIARNFAY